MNSVSANLCYDDECKEEWRTLNETGMIEANKKEYDRMEELGVFDEYRDVVDRLDNQLWAKIRMHTGLSKHFGIDICVKQGKCLEPAFEVPCVEEVCPVPPSPKQLHDSLTIDKLEVKSYTTLKIDPPIATTGVAESEVMETSAVDVRSETVKLDDNKSGESLVRDDMDSHKLEAITHCNHAKIINKSLYSQKNRDRLVSSNNNIPLEPDTMKSNVTLETDGGKPGVTLAPDNLKSERCLHGKPEGELEKVDKYGRLMRRENSDSESDGVPPTAKVRRDPSWSRSPSPGYDRWRKKSYSRSPRRKSRWSRSRSRSPKRRRSRSRTPLHDSRRGGDPRYDRLSRGRGMPPPCNDFGKGRCYRGASCKFLHQDITGDSVGRWSGGGRVKGRLDNRQDMAKSVGSKDSFLSGELEKPKSISPERFFDGHDNHSFGERQSQELYRQNDGSPATCFNFSKGRCYRGASCRYLHSETTTDPGGRWDGAGKGRERLENRQDSTKSFGGRDSFRVGELEREENISPHRSRDDHYRHNFRERRSQEVDRLHGRSVPACIFFAKGKCQKGLSCKFLHEDTSGQNVGGRGRERSNSRADLEESFGNSRISGIAEMDRKTNIRIERTSDGQDRWDPLKHKTQEAYIHNDSFANTGIKPQFSSPGREKSQPQREELQACSMPTADAPYLYDHRENVEHQFMPAKKLRTKSASWDNVDAQPYPHDDSSAESIKAKIKPDNPVIDLCLQASQKKDPKFQTEHTHSNEGLHLTPLEPLPRDLPSQQHHAVMGFSLYSGQPLGSGGSSLSQHDTMRGMSSQHLKVESSIVPLPPGYPVNTSYACPHSGITGFSTPYQHSTIATKPTLAPQPPLEHGKFVEEVEHGANVPIENSSYIYPHSGIEGGSMPHQHSSIATKPILAPQPPLEHSKFVQGVEHGANVPIDSTSVVQRPIYPQTSLEPVLPHVSSTGHEVFMPKPATMPPLASENISGQTSSAPFVLFGEQITSLFSRGVVPLSLGLSALNHPPKDISGRGDQHNPVSDTIDNLSEARDFLNKVPESAKVHDVKGAVLEPDKIPLLDSVSLVNKDSHAKSSSPSKVQDIAENEKHKDATESSMVETESHQAVTKDMHAGINVLENGSPAHQGKNWSPGGADIDTEQAHAQDESKKSKEIRMIKQFRAVLAEFVKEELKPTWREGHMSKEAFKTIVKKVVDKVAGSFQSHQIPKTQERIDHYLASSRPKLTKLVQ
ncbi:hypothetical protein KI387_036085, partial [Taxus chinensis]